MTEGHHHRSSLKQRNKPFKGSARSHSRGRVGKVKKATTVTVDLCKADRKNRVAILRENRREQLTRERRVYLGREGMSRFIVVIPVSGSVDMSMVAPFISERWYSERNRQNLQFVLLSRREGWILSILKAIQVADCILLVGSSLDDGVDEEGREAMAVIRAIGVSSSAAIIQHLSQHKHPQEVRTTWLGHMQAGMSSVSKVFCADSMFQGEEAREALDLERVLCQQHLNGISWRDPRPYMISDKVEVDQENESVKITGFIRGGKAFSANKLIHLPILGESFAISRIEASYKPSPKGKNTEMQLDGGVLLQIRDEEKGEPVESEGPGDMFTAEAMMRIAEGMNDGEDDKDVEMDNGRVNENVEMDNGRANEDVEMEFCRTLRVPKGTSSYQAAWIDSVGSEEELEKVQSNAQPELEPFNQMDLEEYSTKFKEHKQLVYSERHFPDEIEIDPSASARVRLQKYRGVQSLRTSTWDVNENLPFEYGKIFRFANYKQSRKVALEENDDAPFHIGQLVSISVRGLNGSQMDLLSKAGQNITIFGLLKHEQRKTVVNFTLLRSKSYEGELSNKEEVLAILGFRKFIAHPIYSEHSLTNLHKMLRVVNGDSMFVGTVYAPVTFNPAPVLLFKSTPNGIKLVATGSVQDLDPNRVILKRVTMTGSPFKVHKRSAVVRFMFGNPEDVMWFKPVELITKLGIRGHIRESLGTHGYMKCLFERTVFHHDTVAMNLYKRVFPKETTNWSFH